MLDGHVQVTTESGNLAKSGFLLNRDFGHLRMPVGDLVGEARQHGGVGEASH